MSEMTDAEVEEALGSFYADVDANDLQPLWTQTKNLMPSQPAPSAVPWLWKWKTLRALAERAGELITIERGGERRVLALANPGLEGKPYATPTLWGAVQYLGPHESAPAHRHTAGAIRFILEGGGVWTTVDGDACDMRPGDLVLTPSWTWHDHHNDGDESMLWFDGLDLPIGNYLDAIFYENHPELTQPLDGHNLSEQRYAGRGTVPADAPAGGLSSPLLRYRWEDTDATLSTMVEHSGGPMVSVEFVNPLNGRSAIPTFGCEMHRLVPGGRTVPYRKVGGSICVAYRGAGSSVIDGQRFDWSHGDMFVVPSWSVVEHEAAEPSDLFSVSDAPLLRAIGLFREQWLSEAQEITGVFQPK